MPHGPVDLQKVGEGAGVLGAVWLGAVRVSKFVVRVASIGKLWEKVKAMEDQMAQLDKNMLTKTDLDAVESRLQSTLQSNDAAQLSELRAAVKRMDAFIETVKLLKDLKTDQGDAHGH